MTYEETLKKFEEVNKQYGQAMNRRTELLGLIEKSKMELTGAEYSIGNLRDMVEECLRELRAFA